MTTRTYALDEDGEPLPVIISVPNPKIGRMVDVEFTPENIGAYEHRWELVNAGGSSSLVILGNTKGMWGYMDEPQASPMGQGWGLCLYLAAALFVRLVGGKGIAAGALCGWSFDLWRKMYEHGLAECDGAPEMIGHSRDDEADCEYEAHCTLSGADVQDWIDRWRKGQP